MVNRGSIRIGIDPGVNTGLAVYDTETKTLLTVMTGPILKMMAQVDLAYIIAGSKPVTVIVEDARLATYHRRSQKNQAKQQGAGSVKRDCKIWQEYLEDKGINYKMVRPSKRLNQMAKDVELFKRTTAWQSRTSHHARIAAYIAMK